MALGYDFVTLDDAQKSERRVLLNHYASVAQFSVLIIPAFYLLRSLLFNVSTYGRSSERPRSPSFDKHADGPVTWITKAQHWNRCVWWLKQDVIHDWGTRGEWLGGGLWTIWLLYLSVVDTGNDYLHLTKRFGAIGASQLPLHYLLAIRSPYSPVQLITRLSHEDLKMSHQILGRIVFLLFSLHALFYLNFFIQSGFLTKRLKDKDVIFGLISFAMFSAISTSALGQIRLWNYRAFYRIHILIALVIVVPLKLHVHHIRAYVWQIIAINGINWLLRALSMKAYTGTVKLIPGTDLVQISIPLTSRSPAITWQPGQHIYLGAPSQKTHSSDATQNKMAALYGFFNPFTIASVPVKDKELLLVARTIAGNTKKLATLAHSVAEHEVRDVPLLLEGPYGASTHFPDFSLFDKVLLVAGGVGATFVLPVYRSIIDVHDPDRVRFIWAVRTFADTRWAFPESEEQNGEDVNDEPHNSCPTEVYVTRGTNSMTHPSEASEDIELEESNHLLGTANEASISTKDMVLKAGRPNIPAIVDDVFSKGSRVAVVACGPKRLTRRVGASVEQWVKQGHEVYYHEEAFGW